MQNNQIYSQTFDYEPQQKTPFQDEMDKMIRNLSTSDDTSQIQVEKVRPNPPNSTPFLDQNCFSNKKRVHSTTTTATHQKNMTEAILNQSTPSETIYKTCSDHGANDLTVIVPTQQTLLESDFKLTPSVLYQRRSSLGQQKLNDQLEQDYQINHAIDTIQIENQFEENDQQQQQLSSLMLEQTKSYDNCYEIGTTYCQMKSPSLNNYTYYNNQTGIEEENLFEQSKESDQTKQTRQSNEKKTNNNNNVATSTGLCKSINSLNQPKPSVYLVEDKKHSDYFQQKPNNLCADLGEVEDFSVFEVAQNFNVSEVNNTSQIEALLINESSVSLQSAINSTYLRPNPSPNNNPIAHNNQSLTLLQQINPVQPNSPSYQFQQQVPQNNSNLLNPTPGVTMPDLSCINPRDTSSSDQHLLFSDWKETIQNELSSQANNFSFKPPFSLTTTAAAGQQQQQPSSSCNSHNIAVSEFNAALQMHQVSKQKDKQQLNDKMQVYLDKQCGKENVPPSAVDIVIVQPSSINQTPHFNKTSNQTSLQTTITPTKTSTIPMPPPLNRAKLQQLRQSTASSTKTTPFIKFQIDILPTSTNQTHLSIYKQSQILINQPLIIQSLTKHFSKRKPLAKSKANNNVGIEKIKVFDQQQSLVIQMQVKTNKLLEKQFIQDLASGDARLLTETKLNAFIGVYPKEYEIRKFKTLLYNSYGIESFSAAWSGICDGTIVNCEGAELYAIELLSYSEKDNLLLKAETLKQIFEQTPKINDLVQKTNLWLKIQSDLFNTPFIQDLASITNQLIQKMNNTKTCSPKFTQTLLKAFDLKSGYNKDKSFYHIILKTWLRCMGHKSWTELPNDLLPVQLVQEIKSLVSSKDLENRFGQVRDVRNHLKLLQKNCFSVDQNLDDGKNILQREKFGETIGQFLQFYDEKISVMLQEKETLFLQSIPKIRQFLEISEVDDLEEDLQCLGQLAQKHKIYVTELKQKKKNKEKSTKTTQNNQKSPLNQNTSPRLQSKLAAPSQSSSEKPTNPKTNSNLLQTSTISKQGSSSRKTPRADNNAIVQSCSTVHQNQISPIPSNNNNFIPNRAPKIQKKQVIYSTKKPATRTSPSPNNNNASVYQYKNSVPTVISTIQNPNLTNNVPIQPTMIGLGLQNNNLQYNNKQAQNMQRQCCQVLISQENSVVSAKSHSSDKNNQKNACCSTTKSRNKHLTIENQLQQNHPYAVQYQTCQELCQHHQSRSSSVNKTRKSQNQTSSKKRTPSSTSKKQNQQSTKTLFANSPQPTAMLGFCQTGSIYSSSPNHDLQNNNKKQQRVSSAMLNSTLQQQQKTVLLAFPPSYKPANVQAMNPPQRKQLVTNKLK